MTNKETLTAAIYDAEMAIKDIEEEIEFTTNSSYYDFSETTRHNVLTRLYATHNELCKSLEYYRKELE